MLQHTKDTALCQLHMHILFHLVTITAWWTQGQYGMVRLCNTYMTSTSDWHSGSVELTAEFFYEASALSAQPCASDPLYYIFMVIIYG